MEFVGLAIVVLALVIAVAAYVRATAALDAATAMFHEMSEPAQEDPIDRYRTLS